MNSIKNVCDFLLSRDNFLIIMHDSPDGDTVGAGYGLCRALRNIGKSADCVCGDIIPDKYSFMTAGCEPMCKQYDCILTVDVADIRLIREYGKRYEGKIELCIDHHGTNTNYAKHTYVCSDAAAVCEIIFDIVLGLRCDLTADIAKCLYTGISTDTGCFRYSNVTPNTHIVAAALMKTGIDTAFINRIMFETKSFEQIKVENMAIDGMDMLIAGHIHKPQDFPVGKYVIDKYNECVTLKSYDVFICTSWMGPSPYGLKGMMSPTVFRLKHLELRGKKKQIAVYPDPDFNP